MTITQQNKGVSRLRVKIGVGLWCAFLALMAVARMKGHQLDRKNAVTRTQLPAVGAAGTLVTTDGKPLDACPPDPVNMTWPCKVPHPVAAGSTVQVMKADVVINQGLCRYWVQGGPDDRYVGDGPCSWFR